ncbi:MAG TPA: zinc-ribbon domain-containing protein [Terriglobales bacterium]|nr:zinc-ribbon domain-containing protein [Terriglobales bacterium]
MICPKCGEVNSSNFLFCGMCGTILEPARRATSAVPAAPAPPRAAESHPAASVIVAAPPPKPPVTPPAPTKAVPPIGGPSLLGLDQTNDSAPGNIDDLRERAFSGLASYGHPEEPRRAGKEVLLTILLLAALGGAGWWTYKNYISVVGGTKPAVAAPASETTNAPPENPAPKPIEKPDVTNSPTAALEPSTENSSAAATKPAVESHSPAEAKEAAKAEPESTAKAATPAPIPVRNEVSATHIPAAKPAPAEDSGDALFRRGESYLYGRNGTEDCVNALKYLKMASDKQHAKARSMMGTMYATGHCVPRDLPNSYRWFALALRVDPNNSVLEKDLSAVWNQMTPPERQMATKSQ